MATTTADGPDPSADRASQAVAALYRATSATRKHLQSHVLSSVRLTWGGFLVLWLLWTEEAITARDLAEASGMSKANLTGITQTLEGRGLLARSRDAEDLRFTVFRLTDSGSALMGDLNPRMLEAQRRLMQNLPADVVSGLVQALSTIGRTAERLR